MAKQIIIDEVTIQSLHNKKIYLPFYVVRIEKRIKWFLKIDELNRFIKKELLVNHA